MLNFKKTFLKEFSSVKLAVTLFIFLAITTLLGTILPEEPMVGSSELIKKYGLSKYHLLKSLGLTDVFHSWWYLALLTTLGINLTIASIKKVFPRCRHAFAWHRLGALVTHVGILMLLLGSAITVLTGFNGMAQVSEKEGFYLSGLRDQITQIRSQEHENWLVPISKMSIWFGKIPPYLIRVNKTWRENYKTGEPKQWYSDLSVLDKNKKELTRKVIYVNNPLEFMGLDIYQSSWGKFVQVTFNNEPVTLPVENFDGEEVVFLPLSNDVGLKLKINQDTLELYSVSFIKDSQKFLGKVKKGKSLHIGPMNIGFHGVETLTGLQFKSNPGNLLIYPGLLLIICGVFIAFGLKKQVWARIDRSDEKNNKTIIDGISDRTSGKFFEEFEKAISGI
ncbi:MAG: cytochrome c biogenesis protein ResB [Candidatus Melainabacteria bacterium]|nr:cytochrome c biogenesis protein ResB [Candidatus Melainabacteria bacterium]